MTQPAAGVPHTPSSAVARRIIVTACHHAGAERVRAALASHPGCHDAGDEALFARLLPLAEASQGAVRRGWRVEMPSRDTIRRSSRWMRLRSSVRVRVAQLDREALAAGSRNWVGQAVGSSAGLRSLARMVDGVRVVHVVRDGRDVVAAHCAAVASRYGRCHYSDATRAVAQWNRAIAWHARAFRRCSHVFVLFEDWAGAPQQETERLARACGLPQDPPNGVDLSACEMVPSTRADRFQLRRWFKTATVRRIESALDLDRYGRLAEQLRYRAAPYRPVALQPLNGLSPSHADNGAGVGDEGGHARVHPA